MGEVTDDENSLGAPGPPKSAKSLAGPVHVDRHGSTGTAGSAVAEVRDFDRSPLGGDASELPRGRGLPRSGRTGQRNDAGHGLSEAGSVISDGTFFSDYRATHGT